jgi:hypothetical protein
MNIRILSDLHLEFSPRHPPLTLPAVDADVVVLAGDIDNGTRAIDCAERAFPDRLRALRAAATTSITTARSPWSPPRCERARRTARTCGCSTTTS